jgi:hypothetical protein
MSFNNAAFNNATVGPNGAGLRHEAARTALITQAENLLRQPAGPVAGVQALQPQTGLVPGAATFPNPLAYEEIPIFNPIIADYLSRIFCFSVRASLFFLFFTNFFKSAEIAKLADFPVRTARASPYDSPRTPLVARRGHVSAAGLLSQRQSYVKAILIHTRGALNVAPCQRCLAAYNRTGDFLHYAGCISLRTWFNGACSNCIHDDHAATCSIRGDNNKKLAYDEYKRDLDRDRSRSPGSGGSGNEGRDGRKGRLGGEAARRRLAAG